MINGTREITHGEFPSREITHGEFPSGVSPLNIFFKYQIE